MKRAKVYIFDEAISNVDRESKLKILNYLKASLKDRIVIWISHESDMTREKWTVD